MATINFNVPGEQLPRIVAAMKGLYPVPTENGVPEFTDNDWAKEAVRRMVIRDVKRWEDSVAAKAAKAGVTEDDTLLS